MNVELSNKEIAYIYDLLKERSKVNNDLCSKFAELKDSSGKAKYIFHNLKKDRYGDTCGSSDVQNKKIEQQKAVNTINLLTKWAFDHAVKEGDFEAAEKMISKYRSCGRIEEKHVELLEALLKE